jgi:hypothetical protein
MLAHTIKLNNTNKMNIHDELRKFIAETQPSGQVSVLKPYKDIIAELYVRSYTQGQIAQFFLRLNINVSREAVGVFIRKHIAETKKELREKVNSPLSVTGTDCEVSVSDERKSSVNPEAETSPQNINDGEILKMNRMVKKQFMHDPTGGTLHQDILS